ncbi:MAG: hypothetical protein JKY61_01420 [Planctomycetes bacterium]|nr:hypothetical protein [Planctomycetota bacterium]
MTSTLSIPQAIWNHLSAWIREETAAQEARLEVLEELRNSMSQRDPKVAEGILERLQNQDKTGIGRENRRQAIFASLGKHWQISASMLTLRSIAERMGDEGSELMELRNQLVEVVKKVTVGGRMVSATAHMHRSVILDVLSVLFDGHHGDPLEEQGRLLDAEA